MDDPGPDSEGDPQQKRHRPAGGTVESGGGADQHAPPRQPIDAQRPPRVQGRKRNGGVYNGVKDCPRAFQNRPVPPLPGIPGPYEGLQHRGLVTPDHHNVGV